MTLQAIVRHKLRGLTVVAQIKMANKSDGAKNHTRFEGGRATQVGSVVVPNCVALASY